jgi:hypothetical protein
MNYYTSHFLLLRKRPNDYFPLWIWEGAYAILRSIFITHLWVDSEDFKHGLGQEGSVAGPVSISCSSSGCYWFEQIIYGVSREELWADP